MPPSLTVIVPATDSPPTLERCLAALDAADGPRPEQVVVRESPRSGPAAARNQGAASAAGEVLVFVDADVEVHRDVLERIRAAFDADGELAALFGAYDDDPEPADPISRFSNLLHHHVHVTSPGPAETFWAGLGAVRADAFRAAGGFDAARFPDSAIEDVELGIRLREAGARIRLDPELQGRHLRRWTLRGMVRTDLLRRGIPWVELQLERDSFGGLLGVAPDGRSASGVLNLGWRHRVSALASVSLLLAVAARRPRAALAAGLAVASLNASFYALLARRGGLPLLAAGVPLHLIHQLTAAAAVPGGAIRHLARPRSR
jgi:glycosyltransferase involved in cell wall biosynthesis